MFFLTLIIFIVPAYIMYLSSVSLINMYSIDLIDFFIGLFLFSCLIDLDLHRFGEMKLLLLLFIFLFYWRGQLSLLHKVLKCKMDIKC